jgi:hypothetical protein
MEKVRGCAYECGYIFASNSCPEPAFREFIRETAMRVQSKATAKKPGVDLTENVHFIGVGEAPGYPDRALVKLAVKLKGGGDVYINTHFEQMKALVEETKPAGVLVEFVALLENGQDNKMSAADWKKLVKPNARGSELMANSGMFTAVFGGGSGDSSNSEPSVEKALPALWFGYHVPLFYRLFTGLLPKGGHTGRADAYDKMALFPNVEEWCAIVKEAFQQCAATAEVSVVAQEAIRPRGDVAFYAYVRTRGCHKLTVKNLKKLIGVVRSVLKAPLDWKLYLGEGAESWISDENSALRPWPVVSNIVIPHTIYRSGMISPELTDFMTHAAGEKLALALVNEGRAKALGGDQQALTLPQIQEAQLTIFDVVQRVKTAAVGKDGTIDALVSYVRCKQVAAGEVSVEELEAELIVIDDKITDLMIGR